MVYAKTNNEIINSVHFLSPFLFYGLIITYLLLDVKLFFILVGYCIAHNPLLLQLLGHWSHTYIPQTRTPCGRGLWRQGLTDSHGSHHFGLCLASLFVPLLYHNLGDLSRGCRQFFYSFWWLLRERR